MGNQNSRASTPTSTPQSPTNGPHHYHTARRRESIQALSTAKAQAAPPSATLDNAESHPTASRPRSRGPAQTPATSTTAVVAHHLRAAHDGCRPPAHDTQAMGNEQSSPKGHPTERGRGREQEKEKERTHHLPRAATPPAPRPASSPEVERAQQHAAPSPSPPTRPVDVPAGLREEPPAVQHRPSLDAADAADAADASQDYVPTSSFSRPPRLPLPIEEEVHTPGSPLISPQDLGSPVDHGEADGALLKRSSMLSTTTADDDDLGDEFKPSTSGPTVSTLVEWEGPGERVYVTGTFAGWNKKYRLHRE